MKAEELIVGHFDASLSAAQEAELQQMLTASPELQATYDRHAAIHALLLQDAAATAPSAALDELVIGAALSVPAEIGGAAAAGMGFGAKMAAIVSTFAVGGLSFVLMSTSTSEQKQIVPGPTPVPVVSSLPKSTPAAPTMPEAESTAASAASASAASGTTASQPTAEQTPARDRRASATALRSADRKNTRPQADQQPTLTLPKDATVIQHPAKVDNSGEEK